MIKRIWIYTTLVFFIMNSYALKAQDTLPNFTVRDIGKGKVQVSWVNPYENVVQMIVQRSFDSTKYFRSVFSSISPWLPQNGFVDNHAPVGYKVFYRVHYVFEGGKYVFTPSQSPQNYTPIKIVRVNDDDTDDDETNNNNSSKREVKVYRNNRDTLINIVSYKDYKRYKDSINKQTKDTIQYTEYDDEIVIKPYIPKPVWKASVFVFTNDMGFIRIKIPLAKRNRYKIIFYNERDELVFSIKHVKEPDLVLDKSNFKSAGWYFFELYENEKLIEKNKIYVGKDR
ncbi:MAG: hypothetical protein KF781_10395 [Chitinophagaceae bacterium]|nr:hypothetical protein [Chitinophagaceae bacterium]MCW5904927.1 hypothetical protein [Chitinophagaceae bacterium]